MLKMLETNRIAHSRLNFLPQHRLAPFLNFCFIG